MFADDKSIENFQQLFFEFKKYLELQKEYTKLELTEKLTILFSTLIMILVLIILGMVALFYLLFALAYILEPLVGGLMSSFAIIAGINILWTLGIGKVFKLPIEELTVSSNANLGGPSSAAAMAVAKGYNDLIIPASLVGLYGYMIGTPLGLIIVDLLA